MCEVSKGLVGEEDLLKNSEDGESGGADVLVKKDALLQVEDINAGLEAVMTIETMEIGGIELQVDAQGFVTRGSLQKLYEEGVWESVRDEWIQIALKGKGLDTFKLNEIQEKAVNLFRNVFRTKGFFIDNPEIVNKIFVGIYGIGSLDEIFPGGETVLGPFHLSFLLAGLPKHYSLSEIINSQ